MTGLETILYFNQELHKVLGEKLEVGANGEVITEEDRELVKIINEEDV